MEDLNNDLMIAYVYGELDVQEKRAFEETLKNDAALRAEVDGLLATKDLLDVDLQNDSMLQLDAPPAHLVDSILRAAPLVKPREEIAKPLVNKPPFVQRLSTWIFGGGIAISAAAAFLLLNTDVANSPEMAETAAMQKSGAGADMAKREKGDAQVTKSIGAAAQNKIASEPVQELPEGLASRGAGGGGGGVAKDIKAEDLRGPARFDNKNFERRMKGAKEGAQKQLEKRKDDALKRQALEQKRALESEKAAEYEDAAAEEYQDALAKRRVAKPRLDEQPKGALAFGAKDKPSIQPSKKSKRKAPKKQSLNLSESMADTDDGAAPSPAAPAEPSAELMREVATKVLKRSRGKTRLSPSKILNEEEKNRTSGQAQESFYAAQKELDEGRYLEAYDLFTRAHTEDRYRSMGKAPLWGKMASLQKLKRCKEALKILPSFERAKTTRKKQDPSIVKGLFVGAECAEARGDKRRAISIYKRLAKNKGARIKALAALERLERANVKNRAVYDSAAEADTAPAASAKE